MDLKSRFPNLEGHQQLSGNSLLGSCWCCLYTDLKYGTNSKKTFNQAVAKPTFLRRVWGRGGGGISLFLTIFFSKKQNEKEKRLVGDKASVLCKTFLHPLDNYPFRFRCRSRIVARSSENKAHHTLKKSIPISLYTSNVT